MIPQMAVVSSLAAVSVIGAGGVGGVMTVTSIRGNTAFTAGSSGPVLLNVGDLENAATGGATTAAPVDADERSMREYLSRLWAQDWDSAEDAIYDTW